MRLRTFLASFDTVLRAAKSSLASAFFGSASGTVKSFAARTAVGSRLKESANAQATLQVVFMGGRKILFTYPSKAFTTETYLRRHTVRALLNSLQE